MSKILYKANLSLSSQVVMVTVSSCSESAQGFVGVAVSCYLETSLHPQDHRLESQG